MDDVVLNPYSGVDWDVVERHKAQLHTHTSHPPTEGHGGADSPEVVIDDYHDVDYSVLALTGHEYNVEEPTWAWTDWDRDPDELGMVAVQGTELGGSDEGIEPDLLCLFCDLADTGGMSVNEALSEIGRRGGLAIFPHPSRYNEDGSWYVDYFAEHSHLLGVEVVNAADRYPTDRDVWDDLQGRLGHERPVWGFSNDDYHGRDQGYSFDRSRNVLLLEELTEDAVREALVGGRFFYQHAIDDEPPVVESVRHDPDRGEFVVHAPDADRIQWISAGSVVGREPSLQYREIDAVGEFVRARLVNEGGSETGTQPILLE